MRGKGRLADGKHLYLDQETSHRVAVAADQVAGDGFSTSKRMLAKALYDQGFLAGADRKRGKRATVWLTIEGQRRQVLKVLASKLWETDPSSCGTEGPDAISAGEISPIENEPFSRQKTTIGTMTADQPVMRMWIYGKTPFPGPSQHRGSRHRGKIP